MLPLSVGELGMQAFVTAIIGVSVVQTIACAHELSADRAASARFV